MRTLVFATSNPHKVDEVKNIIGPRLRILSIHDIGKSDFDLPETANTLEGNAVQKAMTLYQATERDCFAEDTGLEVDALGGDPGVYTARYAGPEANADLNIQKLLANLQGSDQRTARFRTVFALIIQKALYVFEGVVDGTIAHRPSGTGGFGYDPVFIPKDFQNTFAELPADVKNALSHRSKATEQLMAFLKSISYL
jgi:XTP/dITP diphosphohydrolase